jgi:hypothetical protein
MKNPKAIVGIVAFAAAFIFGTGLVRIFFPQPVAPSAACRRESHFRPPVQSALATEIEDFIAQDERNGTERESRTDGRALTSSSTVSAKHAESVMRYWQKSSAMDDSGFPQNFRNAWREHMQAWKDYADFIDENSGKRVDATEFGLESRRLNSEISRTWYALLRIGRTYGAGV